jgi:cellulose synthase (UDP-forming)
MARQHSGRGTGFVTATANTPASTDDLDGFMRDLSNGRVVAVDSSGPVFSPNEDARRTPDPATFVTALSDRTRLTVRALTAGWILTSALFWAWWFLPEHRSGWGTFAITTVILACMYTMPVYFLVSANRLRRVSPALEIPRLRVAMVVTKAPSEPWPLVRATLEAMLRQDFPYSYDVWLCDESPSDETLAWCSSRGVRVSTRRQVEAYQRAEWPRRRRCKEGNLTYFYDRYGYRDYDVVSQLDADHVPAPSYLAEMVRPFADPAIGYVAAPSVCDKNSSQSWAVRGRLFHEAVFHGPHQLGHNPDLAPVCIGSHYAVRTEALAAIGGIGPELAEDFSTSYLMQVGGWSGAFAIDAHARGDGPTDFAAMVTQEFQWSRSLCLMLLNLVPRTLGRTKGKLRWRFAFALSWYPLLATTSLAGLALIAAAPVLGIEWVRVNFLEFVAFAAALDFWFLALRHQLRKQDLLRPNDAPVLSWEDVLYVMARWPYITWGIFAALIQLFAPRPIELKVTPKNVTTVSPLPLKTLVPYLAIVLLLSGAALVGMGDPRMVGYVGLCLLTAILYAAVSIIVPVLHAYNAASSSSTPLRTFAQLARNTLPVCSATLIPLMIALCEYPALFLREVSL